MKATKSGPHRPADGAAPNVMDKYEHIDCAGGQADGERRKREAHELLKARRELFILRGRRALLAVLLRNGTATADAVRDAVELPEAVDPVCLGAVPGAFAHAGIIARDRFAASSRPDAHARPVSVWRLIDRDSALAWLAAHPDQPTPTARAIGLAEPTLFDLEKCASSGK